ncbi:MAG: tRNA 4-thiouridine(8) synthase ThiI [Oscillospiraceae bacterium]|nr:tRNA 4-thiouridine(8) synthase ThiI [Oscillospiraceae bacterium]
MKEVILIKVGELFLKGLNRYIFENALLKNIKSRTKKFGNFELLNLESTVCLVPKSEKIDLELVMQEIKDIFGISNFCRAYIADKNIEHITKVILEDLAPALLSVSSFRVESKRSDKNFPIKSPEISKILGNRILKKFAHLHVDLNSPKLVVNVEIRRTHAFIYTKVYSGAGGLPIGTSSKVTVLISGGIDSPVAAWMMAKRGASLTAVHFSSPPYTGQGAENKVVRALEVISKYSEHIKLHMVRFTKIQEEIEKKCSKELSTIINRRMMVKIAEKISIACKSNALVTGESLGQVASQTMDSIVCTDAAASLPILRPLIGMDKTEIIEIAKKIETFNISIEPFEDCCTVFTPKHPNTHPLLGKILEEEKNISSFGLIDEAVNRTKTMDVSYR